MVREHRVQKAEEETGSPEARAGMIFGTRAVAVPAVELALAVELDLATDGAQDLVRGVGLDHPGPAQVVELDLGLDRVAVLGRGTKRERVPALDRIAAQVLGVARERVVDSGQG